MYLTVQWPIYIKKRWDIELFFKAMKQNLQIKTFLGTSENGVKSQIFVALICYLLLESNAFIATRKQRSEICARK